ncbi:uncharacterized protein L201_004657 [Kwoniella dendrophila CBS 6074]|uniref:Zn(2)-C6 fungal-type domain-containing protein n=1 Tax=Kwoniella dendrophila CBS 6074 TaxID=1295534 RepID=A0AAX4JWH3_9TREE
MSVERNAQERPKYDYTLPPVNLHRTDSASSSTINDHSTINQSYVHPNADESHLSSKKRSIPDDGSSGTSPPFKKASKKGDNKDKDKAKDKDKDVPISFTRRAAQACLRCRRQKLKCMGGWPCDRCKKTKNICDFNRPGLTGSSILSSSSMLTNGGITVGGEEKEKQQEKGGSNSRLEQLESSVANLLAGLAGSYVSQSQSNTYHNQYQGQNINNNNNDHNDMDIREGGRDEHYPHDELLHTFDPIKKRQGYFQADSGLHHHHQEEQQLFPDQQEDSISCMNIPPPTHIKTLDPPRSSSLTSFPHNHHTNNNSNHHESENQVRFISSPNTNLVTNHNGPSPSDFSSNGNVLSPISGNTGGTINTVDDLLVGPSSLIKKRKGKGQKAEERLATAIEGDFAEPPFKSLVHQPSVWDNREQSRRNSPQPSQATSRDEIPPGTYERRFMNDRDDPINTELVDIQMAQTLFKFFIDHCHPFLPIVNVALDDAFNTIRQSPFLMSAIIAIAARFYIKYTSKCSSSSSSSSSSSATAEKYGKLDGNIPNRLANLAESHLSNTLLRKQHALSDVQGVLLLSAWGLQSNGKGPDSWLVTGHAARLSRRLGLHKLLGQAAEIARISKPNSPEWLKLKQFLPQWRTWLCWFCFDGFLSLGFGRPQSTQFETVDEQGFLQLRLSQTLPRPGSPSSISLYGDVYIAGQVQLTQIGRDLINWGEMLSDPRSNLWSDPRTRKGKDFNIINMFNDLNNRLDDWSKLWVWSGSPYSLYLGSSARIARLQAEHMRLCLNSFALKSSPEEDEIVSQCLKKALNAAMSTIQTHHESSQTDLALSFATDYLTITLAQAAVFLVRIAKSSSTIHSILNIELSVISYYLKMSTDLLEIGDMSETRLSTYLAKTIRDISRAAEIGGFGQSDIHRSNNKENVLFKGVESRATSPGNIDDNSILPITSNSVTEDPNNDWSTFEMDSFLQFENQLDLGYLLGLPGDDNNSDLLPQLSTFSNNNNNINNYNLEYQGFQFDFGTNNLPSGGENRGEDEDEGKGEGNAAKRGNGENANNELNAEFSFGMNGMGNF